MCKDAVGKVVGGGGGNMMLGRSDCSARTEWIGFGWLVLGCLTAPVMGIPVVLGAEYFVDGWLGEKSWCGVWC